MPLYISSSQEKARPDIIYRSLSRALFILGNVSCVYADWGLNDIVNFFRSLYVCFSAGYGERRGICAYTALISDEFDIHMYIQCGWLKKM